MPSPCRDHLPELYTQLGIKTSIKDLHLSCEVSWHSTTETNMADHGGRKRVAREMTWESQNVQESQKLLEFGITWPENV